MRSGKSSTMEACNYTEMFLWMPISKVKLVQFFSSIPSSTSIISIEYESESQLKNSSKITIYMVNRKLSQLILFHICTLFDTSKLIVPCFSFRNINVYIYGMSVSGSISISYSKQIIPNWMKLRNRNRYFFLLLPPGNQFYKKENHAQRTKTLIYINCMSKVCYIYLSLDHPFSFLFKCIFIVC